MKKVLQSIVFLLLLLAISSNLLASSYSRTAGGSWDDWGWSADWIIPGNSFPIGQASALVFGGGEAFQASRALYKAGNALLAKQAFLRTLLEERSWLRSDYKRAFRWLCRQAEQNQIVRELIKNREELQHLMPYLNLDTIGYKLLSRDAISKWSVFALGEFLDNVLGISTPNFYQFLSDSNRSWFDNNIQLGWSKTGGPWLYYFTWWLLGTPGGMSDDVPYSTKEPTHKTLI